MSITNNKGMALVTALMFTLISLGIVMMLMYSITQGTKISGASKAYKTALEASYGALELVSKDVMPKLLTGTAKSTLLTQLVSLSLAIPSDAGGCFDQKVGNSTLLWTSCGPLNKTFIASESPDFTLNLKAASDNTGFRINTKIVDTRCGGDTSVGQPCTNSDTSGIDYLDGGGGVTASSGAVTPQHRPAYYRIEVQSERAANPREKSELSVLYAY